MSARACPSIPGADTVLMPMTKVPIMTTESTPPRLSTLSVDSLTCAGTLKKTRTKASTAGGTAMRKTEPHQNDSRRAPAITGPMIAPPPLRPDHRAMARTRALPGPHSAVMSASVVG